MSALATIIVILLILGAVVYLINLTPIPDPFKKGIVVLIALVALIFVIRFLFGLAGVNFSFP